MTEWLSSLFTANAPIVTALYAQAFFVLGFAIALQWRRESRLEMARALPLLAAFGLLKAIFVWADLLIPRQSALLPAEDLALLRFLQHLIFLAALAALLHFGIRLNWNAPLATRLPWLMAAVGALVLLLPAIATLEATTVRLHLEQIGRLLFLFPGAMLAAWGLRRAARDIEAMGLSRHVVDWLRIGGIAFGAYALFGGLLVPLRAEQLTLASFLIAGVPVALLRLVAIALLAWSMLQALMIFRVELQESMAELSRQRALASDRERIGRELHDGTIQAIYAAGLMVDNARSLAPTQPERADQMVNDGLALLNRTIMDIRRYIFALSAEEGQLPEALGALIQGLDTSGPTVEYRLSGVVPRVAPSVRDNLLQMAREAISNAVRHANAEVIVVSLEGEPTALSLTISDDGQGLPPGGAARQGGHGVPNLHARARAIGARLTMGSRPGGGTRIEIILPHRATASEGGRGSTVEKEAE